MREEKKNIREETGDEEKKRERERKESGRTDYLETS